MIVRVPPSWRIGENQTTDETIYLSRRRFVSLAGAGAIAAAVKLPESAPGQKPSAVRRNERYELDRPLTEEILASRHNIFDELTLERDKVWQVAKGFRTSPWLVHIGGAVQKHQTIDVSDLIRRLGVEERLYRHRCVEAWSMAVPWIGIPMAKFIELAQPLSRARFVRMISFADPSQAPGWYASKRVFPYYEALSLAEATNELALLATGIYGHDLPPQHGAPIRLVVPWKYGFKSIKSIVAFEFTENQPGTFWNELSPRNYGFTSNVDPAETVPWPQNQETMLGADEPRKTLPFNGYGELVAHLYR